MLTSPAAMMLPPTSEPVMARRTARRSHDARHIVPVFRVQRAR